MRGRRSSVRRLAACARPINVVFCIETPSSGQWSIRAIASVGHSDLLVGRIDKKKGLRRKRDLGDSDPVRHLAASGGDSGIAHA